VVPKYHSMPHLGFSTLSFTQNIKICGGFRWKGV
jgi:hypothetical protein